MTTADRVMENTKAYWFLEHIRQHYPKFTLRCPYCKKSFDKIIDEELRKD